MKRKFFFVLALVLALSLCACAPSTPTEIDTTTKFTSEGFTLSIPNEYMDLLIVDTTVSEGKDGTFFSVHEKASVEASKVLWPDDETMVGGFLFGIGRMDESGFKGMMCADMSGVEVVARDEDGNYYVRYHPTDVQLIRDGEYTDADWEQWKELGQWASGAVDTFVSENPALTPYTRTSNDVDIVLNRIEHWGEAVTLFAYHSELVFTPTHEQSAPYVGQLLDDVLFHSSHAPAPEGEYISLTIPSLDWRFDFFTDEEHSHYIRHVFSDGMESLCIASRDGEPFPAGQVVADWLSSLKPLPLTGLEAALHRLAYLQTDKFELVQIQSGAAVDRLTPTRDLSLPYLKQLLNGTLSGGTFIEEIPDCDSICLTLLDGNLRFSFFPADSEYGTYVLRDQHGAFPDLFLLSYDDGTIAGQIVQDWYNAAKADQ